MKTPLKLLGLSPSAIKVFIALKAGHATPVQISKETNVSRPAVYTILGQLEGRGLVTQKGSGGTKSWAISSAVQLNKIFNDLKAEVLGSRNEKEALYEEGNIEVKVYRGKKTIAELMRQIFQKHRGETCIGIQGDNVYEGWRDLLGLETINDLNKSIKKDRMVIQAIVPENHFVRVVDTMGLEWARHFEGRAYRVNEIDESYFEHKGEMFLFKDSVYLLSMSEGLVIEIKHSHIQKMLSSLIQYIQDTARVVDGNQILRELMAEKSN